MVKFFSIVRITFPVLLGYIPLGIAFGILAVSANIPWYYALLMSIFIFAGSGQFLAVALFSSVASYLEIFIALFLINLRHFFYGISILNDFKVLKGFAKKYAIFALTDETFALLKTIHVNKENREKTFVLVSALNQFYWIFGTFIGAYLGANINFDSKGIEFVLTALFVVLAIELYKKLQSKKALYLVIFIGFMGMLFLPSSNMLIISLAVCTFSIYILKDWMHK